MATATIPAPPVREVAITTLTSHFARINWETVGEGFRYEIQYRSGASSEDVQKENYRSVYPNPWTGETTYFTTISPEVKFWQFRVRAVYKGFLDGEWSESLIGQSAIENTYDLFSQTEFTPATSFIQNRLEQNNEAYLNPLNTLQATLCRPGYLFDPAMTDYRAAQNFFVTNPKFSANYGTIPQVCNPITQNRQVPAVIDDVIYVFEKWQEVCKISNDGGATWQTYDALNDRIGFPVYNCVVQQNDTFSYVLGYNNLIQGVSSSDVDFSHDNGTQYSYASVDLTFDKLDYDLGFGFEVERFTNLAPLPPQVTQKADAFAVDNIMTVVNYNNTWVWHNNRVPDIDDNVSSPHYGERLFRYTGHDGSNNPIYEQGVIVPNDSSRPEFDENTSPVAVKKMQYFIDPTGNAEPGNDIGAIYALVMGEWILDADGNRAGVVDPNEIRGIWRLNRTPVQDSDGVVVDFTNFSWTRVYGESIVERQSVNEFSTISRDETHLIVGHDLIPFVGEPGTPLYDSRQQSSGASVKLVNGDFDNTVGGWTAINAGYTLTWDDTNGRARVDSVSASDDKPEIISSGNPMTITSGSLYQIGANFDMEGTNVVPKIVIREAGNLSNIIHTISGAATNGTSNNQQLVNEYWSSTFSGDVVVGLQSDASAATESPETISTWFDNARFGGYHSQPKDFYGTIDDPELVLTDPDVSEAVQFFSRPLYTTEKQPGRQIIATTTGDVGDWSPKPQDYYGASDFNWMQRGGTRDVKSWALEIIYLKPATTFTEDFDNADAVRWKETQIDETYLFQAPDLTVRGFNGYADGAIIHTSNDAKVLGYYKFPYRVDVTAPIRWNPTTHVVSGSLIAYDPIVITPPSENVFKINDPELSQLIYKFAPEAYLDNDGYFKKFIEYYMQYVSKGTNSSYNNLYNLMNSKNPSTEQYTEYLHKMIYQRNRYLDDDKRTAVTKFFLERRGDFYSTKGIIDSYQFLFKLLYNEAVEVEVESLNRFEYFLEVSSNDVTADVVGRRMYSDNGSADITYYERHYEDGKRYWKFSLNNLIGSFVEGDEIQIDGLEFTATSRGSVSGDIIDYQAKDFADRNKSYYVMKLRSEMQLSQYYDDVIRFVHPVGFNFVGITVLTALINQGVSIARVENIVDFFFTNRADSGIGKTFPAITSYLDVDGNRQYDDKGNLLTRVHHLAGQLCLDHSIIDYVAGTTGITETQYNDYWGNDYSIALDETKAINETRIVETATGDPTDEWGGFTRTVNPDFNPTATVRMADVNNSIQWDLTPYDRTGENVPGCASAWASVSDMRNDPSRRLKDNVGNPYDPEVPTQKHVGDLSG
ncbi:baseplate wedge subunit [Vibrio phage D479]